MSISNSELFWGIAIAVLLAGSLAFLFWKQRKEARAAVKEKSSGSTGVNTKQLQLQAYERLILLTDRISIQSLVSRLNQPGFSAKEMQAILTQAVKQEFEHNITQQIYVSPEAWDAIRNFKEQNLLIINQVSAILPAEATGHDLCRSLLELLVQNPKASLQQVVSDALSFEARKILK